MKIMKITCVSKMKLHWRIMYVCVFAYTYTHTFVNIFLSIPTMIKDAFS